MMTFKDHLEKLIVCIFFAVVALVTLIVFPMAFGIGVAILAMGTIK